MVCRRCPAITLAASLLLAACQGGSARSGDDGPAAARLVWQSLQCAEASATVRWIQGQTSLQTVVEAAARGRLGASEPEVPAVDFDHDRAVLIALGRKPTPGYSIALQSPPLEIRSRRATLGVRIDGPAEGSAQAQVLTAPCAVVAVQRGGYSQLRIVARDGTELARLDTD